MRFFRLIQFLLFFLLLFIPDFLFAAPPSVVPGSAFMSGVMKVGHTLTINYTYTDAPENEAESGTTFQWFRYDDELGSNPIPIVGATALSYSLVLADLGKHIGCIITPRDTDNEIGFPFTFQPWNTLLDVGSNPVLSNLTSCFTAGTVSTPINFSLSSNNEVFLCSPRDVEYTISYTGINYSLTSGSPPRIIVNWGDGTVETFNPLEIDNFGNPSNRQTNQSKEEWGITVTHTYDYDAGGNIASINPIEKCTYTVLFAHGYGSVVCPIGVGQTAKVTVWDMEDQTKLGRFDIDHDATSAGVESSPPAPLPPSAENVNICDDDDRIIRLRDNTDFNCTPQIDGTSEQSVPNTRGRWMQWIYGDVGTDITAPGGATGSVIINGVLYSDTQFPIYSRPIYVTDPFIGPSPAITDDITIPQSGLVNEQFFVTLRSWNECNRFDRVFIDGCNLNPPQGGANNVFPLYSGAGIIQSAPSQYNSGAQICLPVLSLPYFANATPVERKYTITIIDSPDPPMIVDREICSGDSRTLSVSPIIGGLNYKWYIGFADAVNDLNPLITNSSNFTPDGSAAQSPIESTQSYWVTATAANNCVSEPEEVILTRRSDLLAPSLINGNADACVNSPVIYSITNLPGSPAVGGPTRYVWQVSNPPLISNFLVSPDTRFVTFETNGSTGTFNLIATREFINSPTCPSPPATKTITIRANPTVAPTNPPPICQGTPGVILDGNTNGFGGVTPTSHLWTGNTGILNDPNVEFPEVLFTATPGSYNLTYTFTNAIGCSASGNLSVVISANPTLAFTGADQPLCGTLVSNPMGGSNPTPGTGTWSFESSIPVRPAPTISNVNDPNATITITSGNEGAYTMRWTVVNGACTSFDEIEVDLGSNPTDPLAGGDKVICGESTNLEGNTPIIGAGTWTVTGPGACVGAGCAITIADPTNPTSGIQLNGPAFVYGDYVFTWSIKSGNCFIETDLVTIRFNRPGTANVPGTFTTCVDQTALTPIDLTGGSVGGGSTLGIWQVVSGSGSMQLGTAVSGPAFLDRYIPAAVETSFQVKLVAQDPDGGGVIPSAPCGNVDSPTLTVTIDRLPANAFAGNNISICDGLAATLNATLPTNGGTGTWTGASGTITDPSLRNTTVTGLSARALPYVFTWTVTSAENGNAGACVPTSDDLDVTVVARPAALDPAPALCETVEGSIPTTAVNVLLSDYDNGVTGSVAAHTVVWFETPAARTANIPITNFDVKHGDILYTRVTGVSPDFCPKDGEVTFTVNPKPVALDNTFRQCEQSLGLDQTQFNLTDPAFGNTVANNELDRTVTWHNDLIGAETATNLVTTPGAYPVTDFSVIYARVVNDITGCFNTAQVTLVVKPLPRTPVISGKLDPCLLGTELYRAIDPGTGVPYSDPTTTYQWTYPATFDYLGGGLPANFFLLLSFPNQVTDDLKVSVTVDGCQSDETVQPIVVSPAPTGYDIIPPAVDICENGIYQFEVFPNNGSSTYNWQVFTTLPPGNILGPPGGGVIAGGQTEGVAQIQLFSENVFVRVTESNASGCAGPFDQELVIVNKRPIMDMQTLPICSGELVGITLAENAGSQVAATTFNIQVPPVPNIAPVFGPTQGVGLPPNAIQNDSYLNRSSLPSIDVLYRVTPISALLCEGEEKSVTIQVKAEPVMDISPLPAVCSNNPINVTFRSDINFFPATDFIIESIVFDNTVLTPVTPLPALGVLVNADEVKNSIWENLSGSNAQVIYNVRPYSSVTGCEGNPAAPIAVTIQPKPLVTPVIVAPICSGDVLNIALSSSNIPSATFIWTSVPDPGIVGSTGSTTNTITDQLFNTTLSLGSVTYSVRATNPSSSPFCVGPAELIQVDVRPSPPTTTPINIVECSDDAGGIAFEQNLTLLHPQISTEAGVTYTWFTNELDSAGSKIPLADITQYVLTDEVPVYVRVRNPAASSGCAKVSTVTFDIRPTPQLFLDPRETTDARFNITCNNQNNGEVEVSAQFGTNHTFRVDGGSFIPALLFSNLPAGIHVFSTKNAEGCITDAQVDLLQPDPIVPGLPNVVNVSCFNDPSPDGLISINATGGTSMLGGDPLLFSLLQDPANVYDPITETFSGLRATTYTVRIEDKNGCTKFVPNIVVGQPNDLKLTIDITSDYNGFDVSCNGRTDGEISVLTTIGGTPFYDYALLDENMNPTGIIPVGGVFSGLSANILYSVQVTDSRGCEKISIPEYLFDPVPLNPGAIGFNKDICEGGDPTAFNNLASPFGGIDGATDTYNYNWLQSADNVTFVDADGVRNQKEYDPPVLTSQMFYKRSVTSGTCAPVETDVFTVVVHSKPIAALDAPPEVCQGQTFILDFQFSNGQAPYFFEYFDGTNTTSLIGVDSRPVPITNYQATTTYTLTKLRDFYGCEPDVIDAFVTPIMINMDATFAVAPASAECSGGNFTFSYTRNSDVEYVWSFNDGTPDRIIPALTGVPAFADTVQHIFSSVNVSGITKYPVTLKARSTLLAACENQSLPQNVIISPNIFINAVTDRDQICSGETINFINSTLGGNSHVWVYRPVLNPTAKVPMVNTTTPTSFPFVFENNTLGVIDYEIVYKVSNGLCSDSVKLPVRVHRAISASFDTLSVTKFIGGNAFANIIHTSVPQDDIDFQYEWQFDNGSPPFNGLTPPQIRYTTIGSKKITLSVTNLVAQDAGLTCGDEAELDIVILLPPLRAAFEYQPQAKCFPADIRITKNLGTGNIYQWKLRKVNDNTPLLISNDSLPTFKISSPGIYVIEFKTTNTLTNQSAEADNSATPIEIFDVPFAAFEARPKTIFIPDEQLIITNRSTDANQYDWDFDDGENSMEAEPTHFYALEGKYIVTLVAGFNHGPKDFDGDGIINGDLICYDTARQEINAKEGGLTRIPNAFTPSTSGPNGGVPGGGGTFNDVFIPITKGVEEFEMTIFDRWGNLIFQSTDKNIGWDGYNKSGVLMPAGVYVYKLTMRLSNNQRTTQVGDVTLIR